MRSTIVTTLRLLALLTILCLTGAPPGTPAHASSVPGTTRDGWPASPEGTIARGWVDAFDAGDSAMRAFLVRNLSAESLARKGLSERLAAYRAGRERFGTLQLSKIVRSKPGELT
jgi:hypothetical protein